MAPKQDALYSIDQVSRDIGIGKDTLRVWERRYGFPDPNRNSLGERSYNSAQVERLRTISRLLDCGYRPGQVVPLNEQDLDILELPGIAANQPIDPQIEGIVEAAKRGDVVQLRSLLLRVLAAQSPIDFTQDSFAGLLRYIGGSWAQGDLPIYVEHLISYHLSSTISMASSNIQVPANAPRIILSTLPGEQHQLGLQLIEMVFRSEGFETLNFGTETPLDQLQMACENLDPYMLALSFSTVQNRNLLMPQLKELDKQIPAKVKLIVGGEGVRKLRSVPKRIRVLKKPEQLRELFA